MLVLFITLDFVTFWPSSFNYSFLICIILIFHSLPSVLWHCWLGIAKSVQCVKIEWLSVWSEVQIVGRVEQLEYCLW